MNCVRMEYQHITGVIIAGVPWQLDLVSIDPQAACATCLVYWQQSKPVRTSQHHQAAQVSRAIAEWDPGGIGFRSSLDMHVILVRWCGEVLGIGKADTGNVARMNQHWLLHQHLYRMHYLRSMCKCVE